MVHFEKVRFRSIRLQTPPAASRYVNWNISSLYHLLFDVRGTMTSSNTNTTLRILHTNPTMAANARNGLVAARSVDRFENLETIFAGASVFIGCVALIVGLLQLRKHCKAHESSTQDGELELEARSPEVC